MAIKKAKVLKQIFFNIIIFSAAVGLYVLIINLLQKYDGIFYPLQVAEARFVHLFQQFFVDSYVSGASIIYPSAKLTVDVSWDCLGIRQVLFFVVLLFSFYQVEMRKKILGLVFVPFIVAWNMKRIALVYPVFVMLGYGGTEELHKFMYTYGNGIIIFLLFILWFYAFVKESKHNRKAKHKKRKK
ncbi:hypothetical protein ACFL6I_16200 [candidate division KSB1 bacterium]